MVVVGGWRGSVHSGSCVSAYFDVAGVVGLIWCDVV